MPEASKQTTSESITLEGFEGHFEELGSAAGSGGEG